MAIRIKRVGKPGVSPITKKSTVSQQTGFGYVLIPEGVDRDKFVNTCYRTNRISIVDDSDGNVIHDCFISNEALHNIQFPKEVGTKGSPVMWIAQAYLNQPMIVGTFQPTDKITLRSDEEVDIRREWEKGAVSITGSAKDGVLIIEVSGQQFGVLKINSVGDENSLLDLYSTGTVAVASNKNVKVTSFEQLDVRMIDPITKNLSGLSVNKEELLLQGIYGEEEDENDKKSFKTSVTGEGVVTEVKLGDTNYKNTINEDKVETDVTLGDTKYNDRITNDEVSTNISFGGVEYLNTITDSKVETNVFDCNIKLEDKKLTLTQGSAKIEFSNGKMSIINNGTGLMTMLTKIVDTIKTLTVATAMGPSGTPLPPTLAKSTEIEGLINQFFNS